MEVGILMMSLSFPWRRSSPMQSLGSGANAEDHAGLDILDDLVGGKEEGADC